MKRWANNGMKKKFQRNCHPRNKNANCKHPCDHPICWLVGMVDFVADDAEENQSHHGVPWVDDAYVRDQDGTGRYVVGTRRQRPVTYNNRNNAPGSRPRNKQEQHDCVTSFVAPILTASNGLPKRAVFKSLKCRALVQSFLRLFFQVGNFGR